MHIILAQLAFPDGSPTAADLETTLPRPAGVEHIFIERHETTADLVLFLAHATLHEAESTAHTLCTTYLLAAHPTAHLANLTAAVVPGTEHLILGPDDPDDLEVPEP